MINQKVVEAEVEAEVAVEVEEIVEVAVEVAHLHALIASLIQAQVANLITNIAHVARIPHILAVFLQELRLELNGVNYSISFRQLTFGRECETTCFSMAHTIMNSERHSTSCISMRPTNSILMK
jgi:hypothetical protein